MLFGYSRVYTAMTNTWFNAAFPESTTGQVVKAQQQVWLG
jgi:hypothetical protein